LEKLFFPGASPVPEIGTFKKDESRKAVSQVGLSSRIGFDRGIEVGLRLSAGSTAIGLGNCDYGLTAYF
jgi:hypothetical protein